ncbi:MAG: TetR/AcrR family transcriptional regulator [Solirubrobacteraceae bacterium]|nr:TetR/AcrR family transcriptional regulator [Solirubrobacteraceae bacterium]
MMLPRPWTPTPEALSAETDHDETTQRILDAGVAEFRAFGVRRASIDGIADRLGVSRTTVYRRFHNKDALVQAVMLREARQFVEGVREDIAEGTVRSWVEDGFLSGIARYRAQELTHALLAREPLAGMTYVIGPGAGMLLEHAIQVARATLAETPDAGEYTAESLDAAAAMTIRLAHSICYAPPAGGSQRVDEPTLRQLARGVLLPILEPAGRRPGTRPT